MLMMSYKILINDFINVDYWYINRSNVNSTNYTIVVNLFVYVNIYI